MEVQLIVPSNRTAKRTWWGRTYYPGSEYYRIAGERFSPIRVYKNKGLLLQAITTVTPTEITVAGGGFGRLQVYKVGTWGYRYNLLFFNSMEAGVFKGMKECKQEAQQ